MIVLNQTLAATGKTNAFPVDNKNEGVVVSITAITGSASLERLSGSGIWTPVLNGASALTFTAPGCFQLVDPVQAVQYRMSLDSGSALTVLVER